MNVSTAAAIGRQWGAPAYTRTGNVTGVSTGRAGYPNYELMGYSCGLEQGQTVCATNFYLSERTHRLESFTTTSPRFVLFGGVRVGMSADVASRREHQPDVDGCGQFIYVSTPHLSVDIWTRGGHAHLGANTDYVAGGTVASIGIDFRRYGVGVLFC